MVDDVLEFVLVMELSRSKLQTAQLDDGGYNGVLIVAVRALVIEIVDAEDRESRRWKNCVRRECRRPVKEIAVAILLRQDFSGDLGGTTQIKYGGHNGASFVLIRRNSERFGGTGIREVGGTSGAERTQIPRFRTSLGGGVKESGLELSPTMHCQRGATQTTFRRLWEETPSAAAGSWSLAMVG